MQTENFSNGPYFGSRASASVPAKPELRFDQDKDGKLITLEKAFKNLKSDVRENRRSKLMHGFPFVEFPDTRWQNSMAQQALNLARQKSVMADWQLLLTASAVVWAEDKTLQAKSHKAFRRAWKGMNRYVEQLTPKDEAYKDVIKNGIRTGLYRTQQPERFAGLFDVPETSLARRVLRKVDKLRQAYQHNSADAVTVQRTQKRYEHALAKWDENGGDMSLKYMRIALRRKNLLQRLLTPEKK
ncbi:MAG TPA: hypothetical protein VGF14_04940 [Alphaproteobacteria bacterium]